MSICGGCGSTNRAGRRFCADCGKPLPVTCAACAFLNEPDEKFCGGCGAAIGTGSAGAKQPAGGEGAESERRPVTVLFADLVGFTRMSQELDAEEVHRLLEQYFEAVDEVVERCGGTIDKHIGDSVMAIFGAPVAHGDDGARALRAALDIHRTVAALGVTVRRELAVHIGVAAGEVIASGLGSARHRAYTVIGNSVNLAARLLQLAGAGETVLDASVHGATLRVARCEAIADAKVKGVDAPLSVWRLIDLNAAAQAESGQPFVGRRAELAQLSALLHECRRTGEGSSLCVRGDAGMGKSRLISELRRRARADGFACHTGLVLDFGMGKGRDAIRELLASMVGIGPEATAEERVVAMERIAAGDEPGASGRAFLCDLFDLPQSSATRTLYEGMDHAARQRGRTDAFLRVVRTLSADQPLFVVIEDLHWADRTTLDHVAALTRAAASLPMVLAMTTRPEGDPLNPAWRAAVHGASLTTIELGPLQAQDALALASGLLVTSQHYARQCIERAAGNPLFLEQLLSAADEHKDALPASLHSLVLARVDHLSERDRAALRVAAVIGQRFSLALVRMLASTPDYTCDNLLAHSLVRAEGDEFLFAHALIRDGIYASLTRARRAELHRAAAAWFADRDPDLRAVHLDRADAPEAARAYLEATRVQAARLRFDTALMLAERGAQLAKAPADVYALNMLRGELLRETGAGAPAVDAYEAALAAAVDPAERCRALLGVASGQRLTGGVDAALRALVDAEPIARTELLRRELVELHSIRGNLYFARGRVAECRTEHEAARKKALEIADTEWEARALSGLADADFLEGRMLTAFGNFQRCIALCDAHGYARIAIPNRVMVGHCRSYRNEFDAGLAEMIAARDAAVEYGNRHVEMFATQSCGLLLTLCARYVDAAPYQLRSRALAEALGAKRYLAVIFAHQAECALALGRADEARENLTAGLGLARETGMGFCGLMLLGLMARVSRDPVERAGCHAEAAAILAQGCVAHSHFSYHRLSIEDGIVQRDWTQASAHIDALAAFTQREPLPYTDFILARGRTLVGLAARPQDPRLQATLADLRMRAESLNWPISWPDWAVTGRAPAA
jgi:class 3 adenylate cyclase/tetratricopeptide (TPR) repeat protein